MRIFRIAMLALFSCYCANAVALELTTEDDPPHNMLKDGKIVGIATEKLEEAFRRVGEPQHISLMPWARAYQSALNEHYVCVYSAGRTAEREALFQWVGPIATLDWVLYTRADNTMKPVRLEDIRKETIGGYLQDVISVWLASNGYHVDTAPGDDANPQKLLNNRFNYWASSRTRASALIDKQGLHERIVPVLTFGHTELYLACNQGVANSIIAKLNDALHQMNQDGTSAKIEARYSH